MRLLDPTRNPAWTRDIIPTLSRSKCLVRTDRFRARTMSTTYTCINNPGIYASILAVNKLIHSEAAEVLYGTYLFELDTDVEAVTPFLGDLTKESRAFLRRVGLVKRASPSEREFDRCEWRAATHELSQLPSPRTLCLGVVAYKPGPDGWDDVPAWSKANFANMARLRNWEFFEWVKELARVKLCDGGSVKVRAIVEQCAPPRSESMLFWVGLSKSIEGGFGDWLGDLLLDS